MLFPQSLVLISFYTPCTTKENNTLTYLNNRCIIFQYFQNLDCLFLKINNKVGNRGFESKHFNFRKYKLGLLNHRNTIVSVVKKILEQFGVLYLHNFALLRVELNCIPNPNILYFYSTYIIIFIKNV